MQVSEALELIKHLESLLEERDGEIAQLKVTCTCKNLKKRALTEQDAVVLEQLGNADEPMVMNSNVRQQKKVKRVYTDLGRTEKLGLIASAHKSVVAGCDENDKENQRRNFAAFSCDIMCNGRKVEVSERFNALLEKSIIQSTGGSSLSK